MRRNILPLSLWLGLALFSKLNALGPTSPTQLQEAHYSGLHSQEFPDGSTTFCQYINGKRHGPYRRIDGQKALVEEAFYHADMLHGPSRVYHAQGKLAQEGMYCEGKKTGIWTEYGSNGKKSEELEWCAGQRFGKYLRWHPNGEVAIRGHYIADLPDETWKWYSERGLILYRSEFQRGTGTLATFLPLPVPKDDGDVTLFLSKEEDLVDGLVQGSKRSYYAEGGLESEAEFHGGIAHGKYKSYWPSITVDKEQELRSVGSYRNGRRDGRWSTWYASGVQESSAIYRNDLQEGQALRWFDIANSQAKHLEVKGQYKMGLRQGKWQSFFPDGTLKVSQAYSSDHIQGPVITYFSTGAVESKANFKNNEKNGTYLEYYPNGELKMEAVFAHDMLHGQYRFFHENGSISTLGSYDSGLADGTWKWFADEDERLIKSTEFIEGSGTMYAYYPDGMRKSEVELRHGIKNGRELIWYRNGYSRREASYCYGLLDGQLSEYYEDGFVSNQANWELGQRQGIQTQFYGSRQKKAEYCFVDDVPNGRAKEWYENGELKMDGHWENGNQCGQWAWFDRYGDCIQEQSYPGTASIHSETKSQTALVQP